MAFYLGCDETGLAISGCWEEEYSLNPNGSEGVTKEEIVGDAGTGWTLNNGVWEAPEPVLIPVEEIRAERDKLLAESDFTQLADSPFTEQEKAAWATYRQELRDLPNNYEPTENPVYPQKPN